MRHCGPYRSDWPDHEYKPRTLLLWEVLLHRAQVCGNELWQLVMAGFCTAPTLREVLLASANYLIKFQTCMATSMQCTFLWVDVDATMGPIHTKPVSSINLLVWAFASIDDSANSTTSRYFYLSSGSWRRLIQKTTEMCALLICLKVMSSESRPKRTYLWGFGMANWSF